MNNFPRIVLLGVFLTLCLMAAITVSKIASATGSWTTKASMPTARTGPAVGTINGKVYVAGGCCTQFFPPFGRFHNLEVYDPVSDSWTTNAPIPLAVYAAPAGVLNGKLYVAGGQASQTDGTNRADLQVYDPVTDSWSTQTPLPFPSAAGAAGVITGKLYVAGGMNPPNTASVDDLRVYDPLTDSWTTLAPMSVQRAVAVGGVVNGILYVAGGIDSAGTVLTSVEAYDPATNTWSNKASMPFVRSNPAGQVLNGKLFVVGGSDGGVATPTVQVYDAANDSWTIETPMNNPRTLPGAAVEDGVLYVVGGFTGSSNLLSSHEAFTGVESPTPTPTPVCTSPPANMVSWWPGDGNADDIQGGNNGTPLNGAAFAPGKVGSAFSFDGVDDFVTVPYRPSLNLTQTLSIDAWVKPSVANLYGGIVEKTVNDHVNTQYMMDLEGGVVFFRLIIVPGVDHRTVRSNLPIPVNEWTHVVGTWDGNLMRLFINGVEQTETVAVTESINSGAGPTRIGSLGDNVYRFNGLIDEVEIFSRALSAEEIVAIYDAGSAGKCKNIDQCPDDPNKTAPGACGCGAPDTDNDGDGISNCQDNCPNNFDPDQTDGDGDGVGDLCDTCANDPNKVSPGECGCGVPDTDSDNDGSPDCFDACPTDPNKTSPGLCGCGNVDTDTDDDGTADCSDACPNDRDKIAPGACGCGVPDTDADNDGIPDCQDNCPNTFNPDQSDSNNDGVGDACTSSQFPAGGVFVIGDNSNLAIGATVYFWGAQWSQNNPMSGGAAPKSFKGFENGSQQPVCGGTWASQPGNSSSPPPSVPQYMAVIVSSSIQKNGSIITGNIRKIVIVETNPGYPSPGHVGTGRVVSVYCVSSSSASFFDELFRMDEAEAWMHLMVRMPLACRTPVAGSSRL